MKAIILAAGRGSRLGSLTDDRPKCLTPLVGKTLLDRQIDALNKAGISAVGVVRGYKGEHLERADLFSFENYRWAETNMVMSLACAAQWLESDQCVVSYSDIAYHPNHVSDLVATSGDIVITYDLDWRVLWEIRFEDPLSDAETFDVDSAGLLLDIGKRPESFDQIKGQYMGLLKLTPNGWAAIEQSLKELGEDQRDKLDMTGLLNLLLHRGMTVNTVPIRGQWLEVDSESDLRTYEHAFKEENAWRWLAME